MLHLTWYFDGEPDPAREELAGLAKLGIDLDAVTEQLQTGGVEKFAKSFSEMLTTVGKKVGRVAGKA